MQEIYEKLNLFYLGEQKNKTFEKTKELMLLKNKNLTTHAAIIGMTGSGKTGLGISLLEEAILDGIPSIVIDPKGDMGNLLFVDDEFKKESFEEWVENKEDASKTATFWEDGVQSSHQDRDRVKRLKESSNITIYTPGASYGVPISILSSFDAPKDEIQENPDEFSDVLDSTILSLLSLVGKKVALLSGEYVLLSNIFSHFWRQGKSLGLHEIIANIIKPPFKKIGMLTIDTIIDEDDRVKFAILINNLTSSSSFENWIKGEPLDIEKLLYDTQGKAKVAIFSISHLNDKERMFFVTLLLNRYLSYMRTQEGSSRLKTILYMDEIYGYFPATSNPPSKKPMLTLLKQARAFGTGVILSTQNPIDLDYKGLSNIGTWFLGRLQTKQDISRVIDGLSKSDGELDKKEISNILANMPKRTFLLKSNSLDELKIFSTRWVMSYLAGPVSSSKISFLMRKLKEKRKLTTVNKSKKSADIAPLLSKGWEEVFINTKMDDIVYEPYIKLVATVKFTNNKRGIEEKMQINSAYFLDEEIDDLKFEDSEALEQTRFDKKAISSSSYLPLPDFINEERSYKSVVKEFKNHLYQTQRIELFKIDKCESKISESLDAFRLRAKEYLKDIEDEKIKKIATKLDKQKNRLEKKLVRAYGKLEEEKEDVKSSKMDAFLSFGMTLLDAFMGGGRKKTTISKAGRSMKKAGKIYNEKNDVRRAEDLVASLEAERLEIDETFKEQIKEINDEYDISNFELKKIIIKPRRSDIYDIDVKLLWIAS